MALPPYAAKTLVAERLPLIFPAGTPQRSYCIREIAASTVFALLYIGAVEGTGILLAPKHVYRMTDEQAALRDDVSRRDYQEAAVRRGFAPAGNRWYADNTREPIRDETLREGLVTVGAVSMRADIPTTSSKPRYAMSADFAALFDPDLNGADLQRAIGAYQAAKLSAGALARISIMRHGAAAGALGPLVTFPSGETRRLTPGPSSIIARAVIEVFAVRFLDHPAVLWLSESGNKVIARDNLLARKIGLDIEADKNLPDIILVDLTEPEPLLVFVEVVATDGAVTQRRRAAMHVLTDQAGFDRANVALMTAYEDRNAAGFKKTVADLAWGSFVWFSSEPDEIVIFRDGASSGPVSLNELTRRIIGRSAK